MIKRKFLLYPLLLILALFLFDKIFLMDSIKKYIQPDFTHIYYETREELVTQIEKDEEVKTKKKKLMVILGSSRLLYFDAKELEELYPNWKIYNLSSAVTTPAYYFYFLERLLEKNIKPDFILLETDANQFNKNSPVFKGSNLTYSFSPSFVLKNFMTFGKDHLSFYFGKYLFAVGKNKPYLDTAYRRLKNPDFVAISAMQDQTKEFLIKNRGHAMSIVDNYVEKDFASLYATSKRTIDWVYANYAPSDMQYAFYKKLLSTIKKENITLVIVWPQASLPMQKMIMDASFTPDWKNRVDTIHNEYGYELRDMNSSKDYYCNAFVDGGHMAKDCYHPFMRFVMKEYYREINK
ncbi:MAG: DUF1574 domain-containing protein [Leptospiraceae bacterium]|nr:DUF1574 domain-containing protein [Leptospiraceae bacterium]